MINVSRSTLEHACPDFTTFRAPLPMTARPTFPKLMGTNARSGPPRNTCVCTLPDLKREAAAFSRSWPRFRPATWRTAEMLWSARARWPRWAIRRECHENSRRCGWRLIIGGFPPLDDDDFWPNAPAIFNPSCAIVLR